MVLLKGHDIYGVLPRDDNKTYGNMQTLLELIDLHKKGEFQRAIEKTEMIK
jgi:hypothetical protein